MYSWVWEGLGGSGRVQGFPIPIAAKEVGDTIVIEDGGDGKGPGPRDWFHGSGPETRTVGQEGTQVPNSVFGKLLGEK